MKRVSPPITSFTTTHRITSSAMLRQTLGLRARSSFPRPAPVVLRPYRQYSVKPPNVPSSSGQPSVPPPAQNVNPSVDPKTREKVEKKLGRLERYAPALAQLSQRTGVSLPALTGAFLVLHEVTAVVPVFLVYWALHALGVGAGLVAWLADVDSSTSSSSASSTSTNVPVDHESASGGKNTGGNGGVSGEEDGGSLSAPKWKQVIHGWYEEGARKVERVGRRYGCFGYEKGSKPGEQPDGRAEAIVTHDAGAVADAIAAYVVVKVSPMSPTTSFTLLLFCGPIHQVTLSRPQLRNLPR